MLFSFVKNHPKIVQMIVLAGYAIVVHILSCVALQIRHTFFRGVVVPIPRNSRGELLSQKTFSEHGSLKAKDLNGKEEFNEDKKANGGVTVEQAPEPSLEMEC